MRLRFRTIVSLVGCLILLQGVDFLLTSVLLARADVYEANPIAREILMKTGWTGLAVFKALITALGLVAALMVARRSPAVGLRLLAVMCLLMLGVNLYSGSLLAREPESAEQIRRDHQEISTASAKLDALQEFMDARRAVCDEWVAGQVSLPDAVAKLAVLVRQVCGKVTPPAWLPRHDQQVQLAAFLFINARSRYPDTFQRVGEMWEELNDYDPAACRAVANKVPQLVPRTGALLANH